MDLLNDQEYNDDEVNFLKEIMKDKKNMNEMMNNYEAFINRKTQTNNILKRMLVEKNKDLVVQQQYE